ncbi:MAG: type I methionyl aminopeptidase, partial [Bacillota bacterium]|nr:type I methionyl aminopeptidase [Bacillota bacterium]
MVHLKSTAEIEKMAAAGRIVADVLATISDQARPGVSTASLDQTARDIMRKAGGKPSFLGYGQPPFPAAICTSIDCEVVHGIPSPKRVLEDGSILSVDVGVNLDGYHADAARTFNIGTVHESVKELVQAAKDCFWMAFAKAVIGSRIGELSATIQTHAESRGYGVVRELTGHGIGRNLHEEPDVPNFGRRGHGLRLEAGMVLAVEPMINLGTRRVLLL